MSAAWPGHTPGEDGELVVGLAWRSQSQCKQPWGQGSAEPEASGCRQGSSPQRDGTIRQREAGQ